MLLAAIILAAGPWSPCAQDSSDDAEWSLGPRGVELSPTDWLSLTIGGRLHYDIARFEPDVTPIDDEHGFRRLRVDVSGRVFEDWRFLLDRDLGGTVPGWKSVYLDYRGFGRLRLRAGNQLAPFSLDEFTSSNDTTFMERALPNALSPGFYLGVSASTYGDHWGLSAGLFGDPLDQDPKKRSQGKGVAGRATFAPAHDEGRILHLGASVEYRDIDRGSEYRISSRPESGLTDVRLVNTRSIRDVEDTLTYGFETSGALGSAAVQAEYIGTRLNRQSTDVSFQGWYAQASYLLTGERRTYSQRLGTFRGIEPSGKWGALEVAARLSSIDLTDEDIRGGKEEDVTLGLNWYIGRNVRLMANYLWIHTHPNRFGVDERPKALELRLQVAF